MQNALTLISLVLPIFLVIFIGIVLRYLNIITLEYNKISSKIIFNIALPLFLFKKIRENNYTFEGSAGFILFAVVSTIIFFVLMWIVASLFKLSDEVRGVFIQGAFRGNYAIVGLALISSVLDHDSLVKSAMLIAKKPSLAEIGNFWLIISPTVKLGFANDFSLGKLTT